MLQELGKMIQDIVAHEVDIITDSEWFKELVKAQVREVLNEKEAQND